MARIGTGCTEIPLGKLGENKNTKIQKYKNTKIQKHENTPPLLTHKYNANILSDTYTYIQKAMQKYKITQFKMNTSHKEKNVEC